MRHNSTMGDITPNVREKTITLAAT